MNRKEQIKDEKEMHRLKQIGGQNLMPQEWIDAGRERGEVSCMWRSMWRSMWSCMLSHGVACSVVVRACGHS